MRRCHLTELETTDDGVFYRASDEAAAYIEFLETDYSEQLKRCADWLATQVKVGSKAAFKDLVRGSIGDGSQETSLTLGRRTKMDAIEDAQERQTELAITLDRFEVLRRVYESDVRRLMSLDEGGAVLLAGSRRPCPLCGAGPEAQRDTHGLDEVEQTQRAVHVEIAKIRLEKSDLLKATNLLRAEQDRLVRRAPGSAGFPQTLTGTEAPVLALPLHSSRN